MLREDHQQPDERLVLLHREHARVEVMFLELLQIDLRSPFEKLRRDLFEAHLVGPLQKDLPGVEKRDHVRPDTHRHRRLAEPQST